MSGPVVQDAFEMYDVLFDHIEAASDKLHPKRRRWKTAMYEVL